MNDIMPGDYVVWKPSREPTSYDNEVARVWNGIVLHTLAPTKQAWVMWVDGR